MDNIRITLILVVVGLVTYAFTTKVDTSGDIYYDDTVSNITSSTTSSEATLSTTIIAESPPLKPETTIVKQEDTSAPFRIHIKRGTQPFFDTWVIEVKTSEGYQTACVLLFTLYPTVEKAKKECERWIERGIDQITANKNREQVEAYKNQFLKPRNIK